MPCLGECGKLNDHQDVQQARDQSDGLCSVRAVIVVWVFAESSLPRRPRPRAPAPFALRTFPSPVFFFFFNVAHCQILSPNRLLLHGLGQDRDQPVPHDHIDSSLVGWNHEADLVTSITAELGPTCQHDGGVQVLEVAKTLWIGRSHHRHMKMSAALHFPNPVTLPLSAVSAATVAPAVVTFAPQCHACGSTLHHRRRRRPTCWTLSFPKATASVNGQFWTSQTCRTWSL